MSLSCRARPGFAHALLPRKSVGRTKRLVNRAGQRHFTGPPGEPGTDKDRHMMTVRPAAERGTTRIDWLDSRHSFSFAEYFDRQHMGFRALRVINDDRIAAGGGFPTHPHRDMEILTYVLDGALEHRDSLGTGSVIRPGEVQVMSAGTGIRHSEFNHSETEPVRLLQIWMLPERNGLPPRYDQKAFNAASRRGQLKLVAAGDAREGAVRLFQDIDLYAGNF